MVHKHGLHPPAIDIKVNSKFSKINSGVTSVFPTVTLTKQNVDKSLNCAAVLVFSVTEASMSENINRSKLMRETHL